MSYIKVIRLKTNEDIIAFIEHKETSIRIIHPISFYIDYDIEEMTQHLVLKFWLPLNMVMDNSVSLNMSDILFITDPRESFKEYYLNFLVKEKIIADIDRDIIKGILSNIDNNIVKH